MENEKEEEEEEGKVEEGYEVRACREGGGGGEGGQR